MSEGKPVRPTNPPLAPTPIPSDGVHAEVETAPTPTPAAAPVTRRGRLRTVASDITSGVTRTVVVLGVVALFTDMSSEMIVPLRLLFLVQVLGTPLVLAGLIEGVAEGATSMLRLLSGRLADSASDRRWLVISGYAISNLAKPLLALVANWPVALGLVLLDRAGKSVRGSPRDAMIVDAVPPARRGAAFGFHRGADTLGAALGPLLAVLVLAASAGNLRAVFGWTLVPGVVALLVAVVFLRDPAQRGQGAGNRAQAAVARGTQGVGRMRLRGPVHGRDNQTGAAGLAPTTGVQSRLAAWWQTHHRARKHSREHSPPGTRLAGILPSPWRTRPRRESSPARGGQGGVLGARFWLFAAVGTIFALGNSSDAFLFLRTEGLEGSLIAVPLVYFAFNVVYALLATPLGSLSDRFGRLPVLALGYVAFTLVYLGWTQASAPWHVWALFAVYGAYYAATEGVARAFVADLVPRERRGTALGWYGALTGLAALPANIFGAWLWTQYGPGITFALGAWLGATALGLLLAWWPWLRDANRALA